MNSKLLVAICISILILACNKNDSNINKVTPSTTSATTANTGKTATHAAGRLSTSLTDDSRYIPLEEANTMIGSYLSSINSSANDTDVRSFSVDADSLRALLDQTGIKRVKIMFGDTMSYINSGNYGHYAGFQSGALTLIIAGYNAAGNYVYYNGMALDHLVPCPYSCPGGVAGNNLLE